MKLFKRLLRLIPVLVVLVVLPRVASFVGNLGPIEPGLDLHDVIRFAFAASLGLGTIATSYFSNSSEPPEYEDEPTNPRERRRREREAAYYATMGMAAPYARSAMWLFAGLDGAFNLADAVMGAAANGLFDVANSYMRGVYIVATVAFGVSPTILAIALTRLISLVDRIPEDYERPMSKKEVDWMRTIMGNLGLREYKASDYAEILGNSAEMPIEPRQLPEHVERTERTEYPERVGDQSQRIWEYLEQNANAVRVPGVTEIRDALEEPKPSKSTISVARNKWIMQRDPFRNG